MRNKLIISSFILALSFTSFAQPSDARLVSAELNISDRKIDPSNHIEIYPNPAADYIVVQITNSSLEDVEFELHSIIGNKMEIYPEELTNSKYRIPVKEFASGYYFLVVKDEFTRFKKAYKFLKN